MTDVVVCEDWEFELKSREKSFLDQNHSLIKRYTSKDLSDVTLFHRNGFDKPILCEDKGVITHTISDIKMETFADLVGRDEPVRIIDSKTQTELSTKWNMGKWERFWNGNRRNKKLNVISLEFSHTKLRSKIERPSIVEHLDFVYNTWPMNTSSAEKFDYPKVQYYLLMSVAGCFTDFHLDFGGSSVWYHVLKGKKEFFLMPPTPKNLELYEKWTLSPNQDTTFFSDLAEGPCIKCSLSPGNTFFIPAGWIHAVFTPEDTFVIGGNFLHLYGLEMQLKVFHIEERTKVPIQSRFPSFVPVHWHWLNAFLQGYINKKNDPNNIKPWERKGLIELADFLVYYQYLCPLENIPYPDYLLEALASLLKGENIITLKEFNKKNTSQETNKKLYCLCRRPEELDRDDWIGCDYCTEWYHCGCVGLTLEERDKMESYICPLCAQKHKKTEENQSKPTEKRKRSKDGENESPSNKKIKISHYKT